MQANAYEDVCFTSSSAMREREREAFDRGIALLEAAQNAPQDVAAMRAAADHMRTLWGFLIGDLTDPANDLPDELKANLVSIGIWVMRETDAILAGESTDWNAIIDINRSVREGLNS